MEMLSFLNRKKKGLPSIANAVVGTSDEPREIVVIFNRISHLSLVAAVMYTIVMKDRGENVTMIDIRDDFYLSGADKYVWIDTQVLGTNAVIPKEILDKSEFINSEPLDIDGVFIENQMGLLSPTVVDTVYHQLLADGLSWNQKEVYDSIRYLARGFEWKMNDPQDCCSYYDVIDHANAYYRHETVDDFSDELLTPSYARVQEFKKKQSVLGKIIKRHISQTSIEGVPAYMVTDTSGMVHSTLRRIRITGKQYVHISEGAHGKFIQTSLVKVPNEKWVSELEVLKN